MLKPPVIEVEVVQDEPRAGGGTPPGSAKAPVHPLAAILLMAVDNLWMLADWSAMAWLVTIPLSFVTVAVPTFLIQKLVQRDSFTRAAGLSCLLGLIAAIPTSIFGTPVGLALLAWTGLNKILRRPEAK
jgi:hypothetical protein